MRSRLVVLAAACRGSSRRRRSGTVGCSERVQRRAYAAFPSRGPGSSCPRTARSKLELACPQGKGVVAGTDALASSLDIHATFDGILGAPIAFGRTTNSGVLFRAVSGQHRAGSFKPFIGCIPSPVERAKHDRHASQRRSARRSTCARGSSSSVRATRRSCTLGCPAGEALVDSWSTPAFDTVNEPDPGLASAIVVKTTISGAAGAARDQRQRGAARRRAAPRSRSASGAPTE